ncbi:C40 family peptidase [Streptomyces wuyuanensis]|uniref:Cell wall-associated hydrolase, NlpC family n=1 Tax=Streptomyces wuyuanensis TaxID=1196353 RepID=A0A1G9VBX7_9ACTN|nr:C40 family peptidase [Streptomyces wuyuanensis]SDM69702.1 Cell wall-associated hydrolase, NlpC family [Streptomyces wuyuanensis]
MPALASHRKPRSRTRTNTPAVGITTAAIAGVSLLSAQNATADPKPSIEEVQKKVDDLYRQAGSSTQEYNKAKESAEQQRRKVDRALDEAAERTEALNESRRALGSYAAAQYRTGAVTPTAALLFADNPQSYADQTQLMDRLTEQQRSAIADYETQRAEAAEQRAKATESLEKLTDSQDSLRARKQAVQKKLAEARELLSQLTAEERARLAELERKKEEEARRKAEARAKAEAEAEAERRLQERERQAQEQTGTGTDTGAGTGSGSGTAGGTYAAKAEKVLSFARAQIGKPYVWGATGPSSFDCSGLTQAAWRAAGVDLPRTTWDQVNAGQSVATADLLPGDLVFFYDDISHVGIYIGDGKMIHAPKPGANVREESIYYMPIHGSVRPA